MSQSRNNDVADDNNSEQSGDAFLVVGIGASAGGIQALKEFFSRVPADSGMAYVVILHLSPDHDSHLSEVLQGATAIPVTQVRAHTKVVPNHVYVISPNRSLAISDGYLSQSKIDRVEERRAPIDVFFRTLAVSHGPRAVSVILSGTGANGSMGMKRIKEVGGLALVQMPAEAEYSDMPRNAIATGVADAVLPVADMPPKIITYRQRLGLVSIPLAAKESRETDQQAVREIFTQLRTRTGHDFSNYKQSTILRRIARRVTVHDLPDLPAYAHFLRENPREAQALLKDLLISVTNFFRDREAFDALEHTVIPSLFKGKGPGDQVRVWVAGCATGEEAYSIAMLLAEFAWGGSDGPTIQLFATDLDDHAIQKARDGLYTLNDAADVSPERLRRFFFRDGDGYRIRDELRELVLFATHNLLKDPPFSHLDLVSCRNLLIYLNRRAQQRVAEILHFALNPGGYLFLGNSEALEGSNLFLSVDNDHQIYKSRPIETRLTLPTPQIPAPQRGKPLKDEQSQLQFEGRLSYLDLHQRLLEQYAAPSVVINEEYDILHLSNRAGKYLQVLGGEPSTNLLKLIRPELRLELRSALYQALQNRTYVEAPNLSIVIEGNTEYVNLVVRPVLHSDDATRGLMLVLFEPAKPLESTSEPATATISGGDTIARRLEDQLVRVKSQLRATIEQSEIQTQELKGSNEELQAMNEELCSSAEELETSKEELQSVNEELATVNQELKVKIDEVTQTNNNIQNLINSTDIGTIFLDRHLRIRFFTPRARDLFPMIESDLGRSISDIHLPLLQEQLATDVQTVLDSLQAVEREAQTRDGRWYLMRILPYRTSEERIEGVVITCLDFTQRFKAEEALRQSEEHLRLVVEGAEEYAIVSTDTNGKIGTWNRGAERMFGYSGKEVIGQDVSIIYTPEDREIGVPEEEMRRARQTGRSLDERWHVRNDSTRFYVSGVLTALGDPIRGFVKIARDLTKEKAKEDLQHAHDNLEETVADRTRELAQINEALRAEIGQRIQTEKMRVRLLDRIVAAEEDERRRIARDIHDHLGQQTTAIRLKLEALKELCRNRKDLHAHVEQAQELAQKLDDSVDFFAWELRPAGLDDLGLVAALGNYVKEWSVFTHIGTNFHTSGFDDQRLAPTMEINLYRIVQEALNNIMKHAKASHADVLLDRRDQQVVLIVEDNGEGFEAEKQFEHSGMGFMGMRERAALLGGSLEIESVPSEGTTIFVRVPLEFNESNDALEEVQT